MEIVITSEKDLGLHPSPLPKDVVLVHFKLVGIGPNTLAQANYMGNNICAIANEQPGFFVIGNNSTSLREALHSFVDRFCNAQEVKL